MQTSSVFLGCLWFGHIDVTQQNLEDWTHNTQYAGTLNKPMWLPVVQSWYYTIIIQAQILVKASAQMVTREIHHKTIFSHSSQQKTAHKGKWIQYLTIKGKGLTNNTKSYSDSTVAWKIGVDIQI